jgi:adenosylmethionine-8-amino-7-oxononanoate aminotransferase
MGSRNLLERDRSVIWHPFTQSGIEQPMLEIARAKGASLFLTSGEEILDGISSWWCNLHGHGHPAIVEAATRQLEILDHVLFAGCTHEPAVQLAERLLAVLPGGLSKVFYSDNGSTAVEVALKMAIQWWFNQGQERTTIVALDDSYHGDTFGAMAAGARGLFTKPFDQMLFHVQRISTAGSHQDLEQLETLCRSGTVAAFIFEPLVQGAGGMLMYDPRVLNRYVEICKKHGVLCIADEVMTGFGRTGPLFASSVLSQGPDMICVSKGLTNGSVPLAITACSEQVFEGFISADHSRTFFHGHTYTGNPVAAAIALASLTLSLSDDCALERKRICEAHQRCASILQDIPGVSSARVTGTILAFDLTDPHNRGYVSSIRNAAMKFFLKRRVLLRPLGTIVYCMPPYCSTDAELSQMHQVMLDFANDATLLR